MKKAKKIIAALAAFILIGAIIYFANGTVGNPISKFVAQRNAQKYIEKSYPQLELTVSDAQYDFKMLCYTIDVSSNESIDTYFSLYYGFFGNLTNDTYSYRVLDGSNTFQRVSDEYSALTKSVFCKDSRYLDNSFSELEQFIKLEIDKQYDLNALGKQYGHLYVDISTEDISEENICTQLLALKALFDSQNVLFASVDLSVSNNQVDSVDSLSVQQFKYSDITENGIAQAVAKNIALNNGLDEKQKEFSSITTQN